MSYTGPNSAGSPRNIIPDWLNHTINTAPSVVDTRYISVFGAGDPQVNVIYVFFQMNPLFRRISEYRCRIATAKGRPIFAYLRNDPFLDFFPGKFVILNDTTGLSYMAETLAGPWTQTPTFGGPFPPPLWAGYGEWAAQPSSDSISGPNVVGAT